MEPSRIVVGSEKPMATDPRKRQRKLERRTGKRKEKKHVIAREQSAGLAKRLTAAVKYPILHSQASEDLWTEGIGQVLISRLLPNGTVAVAAFLVDRYCLGVKDAFAFILGRSSYEERFVRQTRSRLAVRDLSPAAARKIVEQAVAYARELGIAPHPDYQTAMVLFGDVDANDCQEEFEFGKDGKPLYIAGPHDTAERSRQIVSILTHSCGADGFHYLIPLGDPGKILSGEQVDLIDYDDEWEEDDDV
jgi:hypothetical protein